jgi:hypothetical protein
MGQALHFAAAQPKMVQRMDKKQTTEELMEKNGGNVIALYMHKRDRRTAEPIQKDFLLKKGDNKKTYFET